MYALEGGDLVTIVSWIWNEVLIWQRVFLWAVDSVRTFSDLDLHDFCLSAYFNGRVHNA